MPNQEIHINTHTGIDGIVHLDIPVGVINQDIDLTISYSIPEKASPVDTELAEIIAKAKPASDLSAHCGTMDLVEDPLTYQQRIRNEW